MKNIAIILKVDGVDAQVVRTINMSESPYLWLYSTSVLRVGAVFDYRGKDYRVTECEPEKSESFDGYKIETVSIEDEEWFKHNSMLGPKKWKRQEVPIPGASDGGRPGTPTHRNN